jgi:hypothetical protein
MKKLSFPITIGLVLLAGMSTSCKHLIEIPGNPPAKIKESQQFADSATAMTAVAGVYSYPSNTGGSFTFNDGLLSICAGLSSDEFTTTVNDLNTVEFYNYSLTGINNKVASLWNDPYTGLYPVNAILNEVAASGSLPASFKKQIVAEMKVVRALYFFNLVNLFGGVPLVVSTDYKVTNVLPRSSTDSVYDQILKDLTEAQQDLPASYPSAGRVRPNLYTAMAFLAKVHLYRGEWQAAYDAANTVINSNVYSLESDLDKVFLDGSKEAIWQLPANITYRVTQEALNFVPTSNGNVPNYPLTSYLYSAFETGDQRLQKWVGISVVDNQNIYYPFKYKNIGSTSPTVEDFMIFRIAEQYLIRAEAAAHLNNLTGALADLNLVRARAGLAASTADVSSQPDVMNAVMHERQTELFCEWGHRWFDLKRTGTAGAVLGSEKTGWQPNAALYPVPNAQLNLNYTLIQNPGYN